MARTSRRTRTLALLLLLAPLAVRAQLSSVPDLATATQNTESKSQQAAKSTEAGNGKNNNNNGNGNGNGDKTTKAAGTVTDAPKLNTDSTTSTFATGLQTAGTLTEEPFHRSNIPTIAGAGIPTLVIPFTANAPFMQKSSLPEGTFFIAVGAVLAFFGACVLLWRGMVAWSINRSVKRTALASMQLNEKQARSTSYWRSTSAAQGYNRVSTTPYKESNISLDNLTSTGGRPNKPHFRDSVAERHTSATAPPPNLFFSPTAQAVQTRDSMQQRSSGYMPSGYYASPSSQAAGGHASTTIGGLAPGFGNTNRYSAVSGQSSDPPSPGLPPQSRGSTSAARPSTRDRDGYRMSTNRDGGSFYGQPSTSSLLVGSNSVSDLAGQRAPSAYLDELFDNHGNGPRERFR